jgi:F0F1-type ATP synthase assembly protein I
VSRLTAGSRRFLTFSGMALEMFVLIFIGLWLGKRMDRWLELEKPWFMMLFTLLFTAAAIYRVIRSLR